MQPCNPALHGFECRESSGECHFCLNMLQLKTPVGFPTMSPPSTTANTKVRRRHRQGRRCSIASALIASCSLLACLVGGPTILPQVCAASAAAGGGTSTPVSPSLPEVLPAVRKLPDDDVTKDDNDERIEHVTPAIKLPQDQENDNSKGGRHFVPAIETSHSAIEEEAWREQLPHQLQQRRGTLRRLLVPMPRAASGLNEEVDGNGVDDDIVEIYLLGTSHVSKDSCEDARLLVEAVCPDVLFIELCHQRLALLADDTPAGGGSSTGNQPEGGGNENATPEKAKQQQKVEKQPRGMSWSAGMLTKIQQDYATKLGVDIGGEFREAYAAARRQQKTFDEEMKRRRFGLVNPAIASSVGPITVILGDRPVRLTILRAWESLRLFGKAKLCVGLLWSSFRPPSEKELREWMDKIMNDPTNDLLTDSIAELAKHFPQIGRTIIDERDEYMSCKLKQTVNLLSNVPSIGRRRRIVAVVGAGHCPGISKRLALNTDTSSPEERLKKLIETKKWKIDNPHVQSLVTDVTELHFQ